MASSRSRPVDLPQYHQLLWPTLQALKQLGGSGNIQEIVAKVIELEGLTDDQQQLLHGSGPRTEIEYRLAWTRTYLNAVGAIENKGRAVWAITDRGRSLDQGDMTEIPRRVRARPPRRTIKSDPPDGPTPAAVEAPVDAFTSTILDEWRDKLLSVLQSLSPGGFERLCQRMLKESGFTKVEVTGRSGDGGIDGVGVLRIELISFQVFFQCKRYKGSVGAAAIRDFRGAMVGRTDKGLLITTGSFTPDAIREATRDGAPVLDLIDGEQLCSLLKDLGLGVSTRQVEEVRIDPTWFSGI
jgi:restriction system protein